MTGYSGRHDSGRGFRPALIVSSVVAAALVLSLLGWAVMSRLNSSNAAAASGPAAATGEVGGLAQTCTSPIAIGTSGGMVATMRTLVDTYNAANGDKQCTVQVIDRSDDKIAKGQIDGLSAWVPADTSQLETVSVNTQGALTGTRTAFAYSPLVIMQQTEVAETLGTDLLSTLTPLVTVQKSWADFGKANWGRFRIVMPDPAASPVGALGFGTLGTRLTGGSLPKGSIAAADATQQRVALLENRVAQLVPTEYDVFAALGRTDTDATGYSLEGPRAAVTTEFAVMRNAAAQGPSVVGSYLGNTANVSYTLAPLGTENARKLAPFTSFLTSEQGVGLLTKAGLRVGAKGPEAAAVKAAGLPEYSATGTPPVNKAADLTAYSKLYDTLKVRVSTLLALDLSGSMNQEFMPGSSRIDLVRMTTSAGFDQSPPRSRFGLMTFQSRDSDFEPVIRELIPLRINTDPRNAKDLDLYARTLKQAKPEGGTPLYNAIQQAVKTAEKDYDPNYVNRVLVITDGANRDVTGSISLEALLADLKDKDPTRPVDLTLIALGPDADYPVLKQISDAVGGTVGWAKTFMDLPTVGRIALYGNLEY